MIDVVLLVRELVFFLLIGLGVILITRRLAVPYTLGLVLAGLVIGLSGLIPQAQLTPDLVLFVFLPALLFEGSWSIHLKELRENWQAVFLLAVPGLLLALSMIALVIHFIIGLDWKLAFLLGSILSPTDPVAVLGLFRQLKVNRSLSTIIEGESLFNDGVSGSLYQTFLALVLLSAQAGGAGGGENWWQIIGTLMIEAGGGILVGFIGGFLASQIVRLIDDSLVETTVTLVIAYGAYVIADAFHCSGILSVIVASLVVSIYEPRIMFPETREAVDNFWTTIAFLANTLVFLLVGVQLNPLRFITSPGFPTLALNAGIAIAAVLLSRLAMVIVLPRIVPAFSQQFLVAGRFLIFWSGLRGALSMALVLALPLRTPHREELIFYTYAVVLFTLLVQGFSLRWLLKRIPVVTQKAKPGTPPGIPA